MTNDGGSLVTTLAARGISLLRLSAEQWANIERTRAGGSRFSLTFSHDRAGVARPLSLCLIAVEGDRSALYAGLVRSIAPSATFDSRVVFDLVRSIYPSSLGALLGAVEGTRMVRSALALQDGYESFRSISAKLSEQILNVLADDADNLPILRLLASSMERSHRFIDGRALEQNAIELALKCFGAHDGASELALPDDRISGLAAIRVLEDAIIEHDARWIPGWTLSDSDLRGRALFRRGTEELEVFTANKRPLEELLGVDLIYYNRARQALILVQYKMMEPSGARYEVDGSEKEWLVRIDAQFRDEVARMQRFDKDLDTDGPYRLNPGAFFFKLVKRNSAISSAGIILSLGHLTRLLADGATSGPHGGLRIAFSKLDGHYLRSEAFVELVRSGYVGTRGATTSHVQALIEAALNGGRGVVAAIQRVMVHVGPVGD